MWIRFLDKDTAYVPMQWVWMDPELVAISLGVSVLTGICALFFANRAQQGKRRIGNQTAGVFVLGGGVWAMHFIGMQAFTPCGSSSVGVLYSMVSIILSMLIAGCVIHVLSQPRRTWTWVLLSGLVLGLGTTAMHFAGMQTSQASHYMDYAPLGLVLALVLGVALPVFAVTVYTCMQKSGVRRYLTLLVGGSLLGMATASMHYLAMDAIHIPVGPDPQHSVALESPWTPLVISASVCLLLGLVALALNLVWRWRRLFADIRRSEGRLRALVDTAVDGIILIEGNGQIVAFNPAAERMLGWTAQEVLGRNVNILMPMPHSKAHDGYLHAHLTTGRTSIIGSGREIQALHKDGSLVDARLAVGPVAQADKPLFVGFLTDIRQRKAIETSLRHSEEQYRTLISNIPGVTFRRASLALWQPLFLSPHVEALTGWPAEALLSDPQRMAQLVLDGDTALLQKTVSEALEAGHSYRCEYRLRHRNGSVRWVSESGRGVYDELGGVRWIDGVLIDNTETKARNAEFEGTVSAINRAVAVIEYSFDGHVLRANQLMLQLLGYQLEDVQGKHFRMFCVDSEEVWAHDEVMWSRLQQGEHVSLECQMRAGGGHLLWVNTTLSPILDANGKTLRIMQLLTDISASRTLAQALVQAKEKAEAAAAARSTFLANMSHEIRTPMNAIIGFSEALLDTPLRPTQQRYVDTVYRSARSMLRLLNDILDTVKLDKGAVSLEIDDFAIADVCNLVVGAQRIQAEKKGLQLQLQLQPTVPPYLRGDALRVQQVLTNLMGNAVKFTEHGHVRLDVEYQEGVLHLRIQDTGIGIAADKLEHIFAPFAQADASTTRRFGGTGLGTTISLQLVQLMGGGIDVQSTLGLGTEFHVWLPFTVGNAPLPVDANEVPHTGCLEILAVDDVPQNLELLEVVMRRYGHHIHVAHHGMEAVQMRKTLRLDLILMDLQMPQLDGLEAAQTIRAWEAEHAVPRIPIIALSAGVLAQDRRACEAVGMDGFATKPLEPPKLMREIARVLQRAMEEKVHVAEGAHAHYPMDGSVADWRTGLELWGSPEALRAAWARFMAEQHNRMQELQHLLQQRDAETAEAIMHRMRGAAGNLALPQLHAVLGVMEQAAHDRNPVLFEQQLRAFSAALAQVEALLRATESIAHTGSPMHGTSSAPLSEFERTQLHQDLQGLAQALHIGEIDSAALERLGHLMPASAFVPLQSLVDVFDFEQALHYVQTLLQAAVLPTSGKNASDVV